MTNSLLEWHLARDNQLKLAKFCEKHAVRHENTSEQLTRGEAESNSLLIGSIQE